jgi:hypothetical protein
VDVGTPGDASGNFQNQASTISVYGCGTVNSPIEEEEEEEEDDLLI